MGLIYTPNEQLKQVSSFIEKIDTEILLKIQEMISVVKTYRSVGLAAVQIGYLKRLFITYVQNKVKVFINPEIMSYSDLKVVLEEGCLSTPDTYYKVSRPHKITVKAIDEQGKEFTLKAEKLLARVIQHEYDHLEGIMFYERVPGLDTTKYR